MAKRSGSDILVATDSFWVKLDKHAEFVHMGDTALADHPVVRAAPQRFAPLRIKYAKHDAEATVEVSE